MLLLIFSYLRQNRFVKYKFSFLNPIFFMGRTRNGCRIEAEIKPGFRERNVVGFWGDFCVKRKAVGILL